jgi:hypothetical protein
MLGNGCRLRASLTARHYTRYDTRQTPSAPLLESVGVIGNQDRGDSLLDSGLKTRPPPPHLS